MYIPANPQEEMLNEMFQADLDYLDAVTNLGFEVSISDVPSRFMEGGRVLNIGDKRQLIDFIEKNPEQATQILAKTLKPKRV